MKNNNNNKKKTLAIDTLIPILGINYHGDLKFICFWDFLIDSHFPFTVWFFIAKLFSTKEQLKMGKFKMFFENRNLSNNSFLNALLLAI